MFTVNSDESQNIDHRRKRGGEESFGTADGCNVMRGRAGEKWGEFWESLKSRRLNCSEQLRQESDEALKATDNGRTPS